MNSVGAQADLCPPAVDKKDCLTLHTCQLHSCVYITTSAVCWSADRHLSSIVCCVDYLLMITLVLTVVN